MWASSKGLTSPCGFVRRRLTRAWSSFGPTCRVGRRSPLTFATSIPRQRRTTLQQGEATVEMVEHVMAALSGLRIDNCRVEIDAPETPGCDGSSQAFVEALNGAGIVELRPGTRDPGDRASGDRPGREGRSSRPIRAPTTVSSSPIISTTGGRPPSGRKACSSTFLGDRFREELAPAERSCWRSEAKALRAAGIGSRTTESDLLIFGPDGVIGNQLRYRDECVRHKILDMVGDLALLDKDLSGHVVAHRSGHQLNAALVRKLWEAVNCKDLVTRRRRQGRLEINDIMRILPHRYPFLLVDRVMEHDPTRRVVALKNVSCNEPVLPGSLAGPTDHAWCPDRGSPGSSRRHHDCGLGGSE